MDFWRIGLKNLKTSICKAVLNDTSYSKSVQKSE